MPENDSLPIPVEPDVNKYLELVMSGMGRGEAALQAGYSQSMSRNPKQIEKTLAFKEALEDWIPETRAVKKLSDGMDATESIQTRNGIILVDDFATQHKFLETFYKLKGKLKGAGEAGNTYIDKAIIVKWGDIPKEDQDNIIKVDGNA